MINFEQCISLLLFFLIGCLALLLLQQQFLLLLDLRQFLHELLVGLEVHLVLSELVRHHVEPVLLQSRQLIHVPRQLFRQVLLDQLLPVVLPVLVLDVQALGGGVDHSLEIVVLKALHQVELVLENDEPVEGLLRLVGGFSRHQLPDLSQLPQDFPRAVETLVEGDEFESAVDGVVCFGERAGGGLALDEIVEVGLKVLREFGVVSFEVDDSLGGVGAGESGGEVESEVVLVFIIFFLQHSLI